MAYGKRGASPSKTTHTAELTTGQLVLAVSTFLIVLLGVFLLGIIVGEYQYKLRESRMAADTTTAEETSQGEGVQPNGFPDVRKESTPAAKPPEAFRPKPEPAPQSVVVPAPSAHAKAPAEPAPVTKEPLSVEPPAPATPKPASEPGQEMAPVTLEPIEPKEPPAPAVEVGKTEPTPPEKKPEPAPMPIKIEPIDTVPETPAAAAPTPGGYSVQVAALSEMKNAEALKKRLTEHTTLPVEIVPSGSKKLHVVLVGRFATEAEAERVRDQLRKETEFSQAFVSKR